MAHGNRVARGGGRHVRRRDGGLARRAGPDPHALEHRRTGGSVRRQVRGAVPAAPPRPGDLPGDAIPAGGRSRAGQLRAFRRLLRRHPGGDHPPDGRDPRRGPRLDPGHPRRRRHGGARAGGRALPGRRQRARQGAPELVRGYPHAVDHVEQTSVGRAPTASGASCSSPSARSSSSRGSRKSGGSRTWPWAACSPSSRSCSVYWYWVWRTDPEKLAPVGTQPADDE